MRCTAGQSFLSSRRKRKNICKTKMLGACKWLISSHSNGWRLRTRPAGPLKKWKKTGKKQQKKYIICFLHAASSLSLCSYFPMEQRKHQSLCRRVEKDYLKRQILNQRPRGTWRSFPTSTTAPGLLCLCLGAWGAQACQHSPKKKLILLEMARLIFSLWLQQLLLVTCTYYRSNKINCSVLETLPKGKHSDNMM